MYYCQGCGGNEYRLLLNNFQCGFNIHTHKLILSQHTETPMILVQGRFLVTVVHSVESTLWTLISGVVTTFIHLYLFKAPTYTMLHYSDDVSVSRSCVQAGYK